MFRETRRRRRDKLSTSVHPAEISPPDATWCIVFGSFGVMNRGFYTQLLFVAVGGDSLSRSELFVLHLYECWKFYSSCSALRQICNFWPTLILWSFKWGLNYLLLKLNYCHPFFFYILFISLVFFLFRVLNMYFIHLLSHIVNLWIIYFLYFNQFVSLLISLLIFSTFINNRFISVLMHFWCSYFIYSVQFCLCFVMTRFIWCKC